MINSVKISGSTAYCLINNETTKTYSQFIKPTSFSCVTRAWNGHVLTWQKKIFRVGKFDKLFWSFHWMCPQQHQGVMPYPDILVERDINTQWNRLLAKTLFPTSSISVVYYHTTDTPFWMFTPLLRPHPTTPEWDPLGASGWCLCEVLSPPALHQSAPSPAP